MILPKIQEIVINEFTLYKLKSEIVLDMNDGVFCLAGANGLGKSTFISILSYALTGIVVDPKRNFSSVNSIPKFFKNNEKFASSYFNGRIDESKRELADVSIKFNISNFLYQIKRNFFDASGLIEFSRVDIDTGEETIDQSLTSYGLLSQYKDLFARDIGVTTFEQYVFLQNFVLTFDESKKLIFWDDSIMNRVLYLFFGIDAQKADIADDLRKKIAKHESNMRNLQWNITQNSRLLKELMSTATSNSDNAETIEATITQLEEKEELLTQLHEALQTNQSQTKSCELNLSNVSLKVSNLKKQYDDAFNNMYNVDIPIEKDQQIVSVLRKISKKILNNEDVTLDFEELKSRIKSVSESLRSNVKNNNLELLKSIDKEIQQMQNELNELVLKKERLAKEYIEISAQINEATEFVEKFKIENEQIIIQALKLKDDDINKRIEALKSIINKDELKKEEDTKIRDLSKIELGLIEKEIRKNYHSAEERFLPIFKGYANSFIGLDIDVELKSSSKGIGLVLKVNNTERTERFQLSESQQYFIDIALRFALIEFTSSPNAFMLIDTPEGSLDIAYESRAGKMFADFVLKGYDVVMTANINSSQLLLQMAKKCKREKMKIERMTNWTILSTVQQEEQDVIEDAFNKIEAALDGNN
ncbi:AAA family ATPase [Dysgonomonadaceae bacterium zrk40]|nr:AAA family ATPase [Dysgonomonadaceae bacterium zrk40]